jgi:hypothetical protein
MGYRFFRLELSFTFGIFSFLICVISLMLKEKIPWEGEFTLRSDPWAGLIASCGSFYPMVLDLTAAKERYEPISLPVLVRNSLNVNLWIYYWTGAHYKPGLINSLLRTGHRGCIRTICPMPVGTATPYVRAYKGIIHTWLMREWRREDIITCLLLSPEKVSLFIQAPLRAIINKRC